ncbi:MAG: hypothetical protein ACTSU5_20640 [Promethearchaeota archaeon]
MTDNRPIVKLVGMIAPDQVQKVLEVVSGQLEAFLEGAGLSETEFAEGHLILEGMREIDIASVYGDAKKTVEVLEKAIDDAYLFVVGVVGRPFFILDGMHGGILYYNAFPNLANPERRWAGYSGFPVGFEEFDWPEYAIEKVEGAIYLAEQTGLPITLQIGMSTFESLSEYYPEFVKRVKDAARHGQVEIVDGTYSQPHDLVQGSESNIRDFQVGLAVSEKVLGRRPRVHVRQELGWHPQIPQMLSQLNYEAAAARTRCSGWIAPVPKEKILWRGLDGSLIPALPAHEGLPTGDFGGGQMYAHVGETLAKFKNSSYKFAAYTNLEDLTDPMPGRVSVYVASALSPLFGKHVTYSQFFAETPDLGDGDEYYIKRDAVGVTWQCKKSGAFWKRKDQYLAVKPGERDLLNVEKLLAFVLLAGKAESAPDTTSVLEACWKLFLQALNHDAYTVSWHKTGSYFKARRRRLGAYKGPKPWLRVGEKALQYVEAVRDKCAELARAAFKQLESALSREAVADGRGEAGSGAGSEGERTRIPPISTVVVFNPSDFLSNWLVDVETESLLGTYSTAPPGGVAVVDEDGQVLPSTTLRPDRDPTPRSSFTSGHSRIVFRAHVEPLGVGLFRIVPSEQTGMEDRGGRVTGSFTFDPKRLQFSGPRARLTFGADGSIAKFEFWRLGANNADEGASGVFEPAPFLREGVPNHLRFKKPSFRLVHAGPLFGELLVADGTKSSRVRIFPDTPRVEFETSLGGKHEWVKLFLEGGDSEVVVDYPFGKEATSRENLTALNFVEIRCKGGGGARLLYLNTGMQNISMLDGDLPEKELWGKINSTRLRASPPALIVNQLVKRDTYHYALSVVGGDERDTVDPDAMVYREVEAYTGRPVVNAVRGEIFPPRPKAGDLKPTFFSSNPNVLVTMVRPLSARVVEFRLFNPTWKSRKTKIDFPWNAVESSVVEVDLEGNPRAKLPLQDGSVELEVGPWQFRTYQLSLKNR